MKNKQELSIIFKDFQNNIKRKDTFSEGINSLIELRKYLKEIIDYIFLVCKKADFSKMPISKDKTIGYYLYHLTRIEDITCNTLILDSKEIFFENKYDKLINSHIITTGNELNRQELIDFSSKLNIDQLKKYIDDVYNNTNEMIKKITFEESKLRVLDERKTKLIDSDVVSQDENAFWLVDYWCKKTYAGLMLMPFSRHHMLHLGGCLRIINKIKK